MKRQLERQAGVYSFDFDLNTGIGQVFFAKGSQIDSASLGAAAKRAGFKPIWLDVVVTGAVIEMPSGESSSGFRIRADGTAQEFTFRSGDTQQARRRYSEILALPRDETLRVKVRGRTGAIDATSNALTLSSFEVVGGG